MELPNSALCVRCRGGKRLCGLTYCPVLVKLLVRELELRLSGNDIEGSSPPSVFVGRYSYPYVRVGPAVPPERGNTSVYDTPELWLNMSLDDILRFRYSLVRGTRIVRVDNVSNRYVSTIQELALTLRPVDVGLIFDKTPKPRLYFDESLPPQGPSVPLKDFRIYNNPVGDRRVERVFNDTELRAADGIIRLYRDGVPISAIQRLMSVGGLGRYRRLVPTRWSITAVDSIISDRLVAEVKRLPVINNYQLYIRNFMNNLFIGILAPRPWSFEWMEAWFPGSTWNRFGTTAEIEGDYESFMGRTDYPGIGGCYYAARLASAESLLSIGRQATVVLWREIYEGFDLPIGVWFVRENVRAMFKDKPIGFNSLEDLLKYLIERKVTRADLNTWVRKSHIIRLLLTQRSLDGFARGG